MKRQRESREATSLEEVYRRARRAVRMKGSPCAWEEVAIENVFRLAISGNLNASNIIYDKAIQFLSKSDKCATLLAPDERVVEMPLDQETVDSWHAAGYFPAGTSWSIEDIAEEELNIAYERWKQERSCQTRSSRRRRRRLCS